MRGNWSACEQKWHTYRGPELLDGISNIGAGWLQPSYWMKTSDLRGHSRQKPVRNGGVAAWDQAGVDLSRGAAALYGILTPSGCHRLEDGVGKLWDPDDHSGTSWISMTSVSPKSCNPATQQEKQISERVVAGVKKTCSAITSSGQLIPKVLESARDLLQQSSQLGTT